MKRLSLILVLVLVLSTGCATQALKMNPEDLQGLQTTKSGASTSGCVALKLNASSGVVGGDNRSIVTWGELAEEAVNWCIGK